MEARAHPGNAVVAPFGLDSGVLSTDLLGTANPGMDRIMRFDDNAVNK
jgi:hypothetical protein